MAFDSVQYTTEYMREHYHRFQILIPKDKADIVKQAAQQAGLSVSEWFIAAVEKAYRINIHL